VGIVWAAALGREGVEIERPFYFADFNGPRAQRSVIFLGAGS
jgi:hypothetical protein